MGGPLRRGPWKEAGLVLHSCLAAWAAPLVLPWCSRPSPPPAVSYAREWTGSDPTRPVHKDHGGCGATSERSCGSSTACEPRVPQAGSQVNAWVSGLGHPRGLDPGGAGPRGARAGTSCSHLGLGLGRVRVKAQGVCDSLPGADSSVPAGEAHSPLQSSVRAGRGRSQQGWGLGPNKSWGAVEDRGLCGRRSICAEP